MFEQYADFLECECGKVYLISPSIKVVPLPSDEENKKCCSHKKAPAVSSLIPSVNVLLIKDNRVCFKRAGDQQFWVPPSANIESGEDILTTAQRAIFQNVNILVETSRLEFLEVNEKDKQYWYRVDLRPGEIVEEDDWRWIEVEKIGSKVKTNVDISKFLK